MREEDRGLFGPALRYLVLDEIHSYRGALASEIACLIRRLKERAGIRPGGLVGIGTSATVAAREGGASALARFATAIFGEEFAESNLVGESLAPIRSEAEPWTPAPPELSDEEIGNLDPEDPETVVRLAEKLTGRRCPASGPIAARIAGVLDGNAVVRAVEEAFAEPRTVEDAVRDLRGRFPERASLDDHSIRREIEAYLLVGSVGDEEHAPRLRPKLHTFFHGVYDVALCLNPDCRALVPQGGASCQRCGSAARPAALCRTCGQDFVKLRMERDGDDRPMGTGDFYSDERTIFLTHGIHELPDRPEDEEEGEQEVESAGRDERKRPRRPAAVAKLDPVTVCRGCGRLLPEGPTCPACGGAPLPMLRHDGKLNTCPACGDVFTRGDIVTPLRTGTASTVSVLATHHLDNLRDDDRRLLVFGDNRQDVAHQAGYTVDKHRTFALRHLIADEVRSAGAAGLALEELPQRLLDRYGEVGIAPRRPTRFERDKWLDALTYEAASEFSRYSRQRASLENLGIVGVEYEFLAEMEGEPAFRRAASEARLEPALALRLVHAVLDVLRKNRAIAYDFFQEYIDPNAKRRYRELEAEPYNVRFPDRDRGPKAFALDRPDHIRKAHRVMGFFQENPKAGQLTAPQKLAARIVGGREAAEAFLRSVVPLLEASGILVPVPRFPIPGKEATHRLRPLQIAPRVIRLIAPEEGFRCNACQTWRPYPLPTCPAPRCGRGSLQPAPIDRENYYVRLYLDRRPQRLAVAEHSAQISAQDRAARETAFKEGRLNVLVCTPTLELGVDIGPLLTCVLRNAPPTPANYAQRVGRAGRRLRIGFVTTFCTGGAHDRHAFEEPEWLVAGRFDPPRVRLDNARIVERHLRAHLLGCLDAQLPALMGDLLDDLKLPTRWECEKIETLFEEASDRRDDLVARLAALLEADRSAGRAAGAGPDVAARVVDEFRRDVTTALEGWWERVRQLDREYREFATIGSPRQDEKKASARKRAYYEITQDRERAYTLNYLSTRGLLPAYQFPVDTFLLDPGVGDTPTLFRSSAIAIEEFAPGNFVYANGHKLKSIRVLFPGGPGAPGGRPGRTDAETSGRLRALHFCQVCGEAVDAPRNACPRCAAPLPAAIDAVFVEAFEAEESLRIGSDEESRQRLSFDRRESLLTGPHTVSWLYRYPLFPLESRRFSPILVTNWGRRGSKSSAGDGFWLCPDCGRHQPWATGDADHEGPLRAWKKNHARLCSGEPGPLVLAYQFETDCLVLTIPARDDAAPNSRFTMSPTAVTLAEALVLGAGDLLEIEPGEISSFVRKSPPGALGDEIVFYETVPGGAGYLEEMARRLPEVAKAAAGRLYGHACSRACYLCLKRYGNQGWHPFFDKDIVRDVLVELASREPIDAVPAHPGEGLAAITPMLAERRADAESGGARDPVTGRYRKGAIEEPLRLALSRIEGLPEGDREFEIRDGGKLLTVPDFTWAGVKLAVYCDGFAVHGNREILELDSAKRNRLQSLGWVVLTYWGRTILKDPDACARQVADVYLQRAGRPAP